MKKNICIVIIILLWLLNLSGQEINIEPGIELFEDPEEIADTSHAGEDILPGTAELEILNEDENSELFEEEDNLDIFDDDKDPNVFDSSDTPFEKEPLSPAHKKIDFMGQFFDNKSGSITTDFYFYYKELQAEENANPEPDKKRHVFQQHSTFSTFISAGFWRINLTTWIDIGNQQNTYIPAYIDLQHQDWQDWFQDPERERRFFKISELNLSLFFAVCDISLGKKDFDNSLSSLYQPADNYRAVDSNEPFSTNRFGKYQIAADFFLDTTTLNLVIFPVYQGGKGFSPLSRWGYYKFKEMQNEGGAAAGDTEDDKREYPDITWENISYLMRLKTTLLGIDMFVGGFYGLAGNVVSELVTNEETGEMEKESETVPVVNVTGGFTATVKKLEMHGEALYNFTPASKDDDYLRYVAGGRYILDGFPETILMDRIELIIEYAGEVLFKEQSNTGYTDSTGKRRGMKNDILASILLQFSEKLKLNAFGQYNFDDSSLIFSWNTNYQWLGNMALEFGTQYFYGPEESDLYYWRHNNRLMASVVYTF